MVITKQLLGDWGWFMFGMAVYMLKRAYYLVTGPNPVANSYGEFLQRCWIPLFVRAVFDSGVYWLTFYPALLTPILKHLGWDSMVNHIQSGLLQIGPAALFFGLGVDSIVDFGVSKVPYVKDWLPQMPGPLKPVPAPEN